MLMFFSVIACSKPASPAGGADPVSPPDPTVVEAPTSAKSDIDWVGTWSSPSCGDRTYERRIELTADLHANVEERVSPCPEGARCMWSGIVVFEGTYVATSDHVALTLGAPLGATPSGPDLVDVPTHLTWNDGKVHQGSCAYTR